MSRDLPTLSPATVRPFASRHILLGVTGGIACYKSVTLARRLTQAGATVDVVLTRGAREFVGAITFEAVTGRAVLHSLLGEGHALDHIRLARAADLVFVAPATADFLARAAAARADDLLTAILLATEAPVLLAPAMNDNMWAHSLVQQNVQSLRGAGYTLIEPDSGPLAEGDSDRPGRMPEPESLMAHAGRMLEAAGNLSGRHVVVTAGPTREALDPVRFISNHSSGRMGVSIAEAAWRRGARVTLIAGPLSVPLPIGPRHVAVDTTNEMRDAVAAALPDADALVMAAAPSDYRAASPADSKMKRESGDTGIQLVANPDILIDTIPHRKHASVVVGFALETDDVLANARKKLDRKQLDLLVVNDAREPGAGFGVDTNVVTLLSRSGAEEALPLMSKADVADAILDRVELLLGERGS